MKSEQLGMFDDMSHEVFELWQSLIFQNEYLLPNFAVVSEVLTGWGSISVLSLES